MYSNVHGVAGTLLVLGAAQVSPDPVIAMAAGGIAAFYSHDVLDRLGEKSYGDLKTTALWEGIPFALFACVAFLSGQWWLYAFGWVMGNLMDIIDKKLYLAIIWPSRFGPSWKLFPCHRRKPDIQFTLNQTKLISICSSIAVFATYAL